jgi:hypothetical protein
MGTVRFLLLKAIQTLLEEAYLVAIALELEDCFDCHFVLVVSESGDLGVEWSSKYRS